MLLLFVAFFWTIGAKARVLWDQQPASLIGAIVEVSLPDIAFFLIITALFSGMYLIGMKRAAARTTVLLSGLILIWSVLNAAWLLSTSVQLQPGVLAILLKDPIQFWPTVQTQLVQSPLYALPILFTILGTAVWFLWRVCKPLEHLPKRGIAAKVFWVSLCIGLTAYISHEIERRVGQFDYSARLMGFNSHWAAALSTMGLKGTANDDEPLSNRQVPRAGERDLVPPPSAAPRPNVVVIFLESVSHSATSLGNPELTNTPMLERLAAEGMEFERTYVPVPQTNKAFFAGLTGCTPDIAPDYAEAVLVEKPYESLATILQREGYRSAFFQMAEGAFEGGPGLFANLGFDWAWFFENLRDESARIDYLSGDDLRMIDPMFEWVDQGKQPFLLAMITTVSHDPYMPPEWYEPNPSDDRHSRYLQCVEFGDLFVAAVVEQLESRGLLDNTLLCVIGDHGDSFRADARRARWVPYDEVVRVPWVLRWPGHVTAGAKADWLSSQLDMTPTILSILGWDVRSAAFDGRDATTRSDPTRRLYFTSWYEDSPRGFIEGDRKIIYWPYTDTVFAFDLASDQGEKHPVMIEDELTKQQLVQQIDDWWEAGKFDAGGRPHMERTLFDYWRVVSYQRNITATFETRSRTHWSD